MSNKNVRICNFSNLDFEGQFLHSIMDTGFAVITGFGINHDIIKKAQMDWRLFFLSGQEEKNKFINSENPNLGYHGYKKEQAKDAKVPDLKEFFHWMPDANIPAEVYSSTQFLYFQLEDMGLHLLDILSVHHGFQSSSKGQDYVTPCENTDKTLLRSLYYPATDFSKEPGAVRAAAHEDINYITLLVAASAPGLEVLDKEGNWHAVPYEENSICVNIGDMLQLASGGFYKSTTHRVVNPDSSNSDRVSIPLFIHPHTNTVLDSTGFTAGQYLDQRIKEIYGDRK